MEAVKFIVNVYFDFPFQELEYLGYFKKVSLITRIVLSTLKKTDVIKQGIIYSG